MENKKRLELRLDPDTVALLDSLLARTNLTKTSLIKKALVVYASTLNKGHIFTVQYKQTQFSNEKNEKRIEDNRSFEEIIEDLEKE